MDARATAAWITRLIAACALLFSLPAQADRRTIDFHQMPVDAGLSQNTVTDILQDHRGFMWFGTMNGVNRFDGDTFTVFPRDPRQPNHLKPIWVSELLEDNDGNIWVSGAPGILERINTVDGSVSRFGGQLQRLGVESVALLGGYSLGLAPDGTVWFAAQKGLFSLAPGQDEFQPHIFDNSDELGLVTDINFEDSSDPLLASTTGLWRLSQDDSTLDKIATATAQNRGNSNPGVTATARDPSGDLWLGTANGLLRMSPGEPPQPILRSLNGNRESLRQAISDLLIDRNGTLWAGTDGGGLLRYDRDANGVEVYVHSPDEPRSLGFNDVSSLHEDRSGLIWIGMAGGGLNQINPSRHRFGQLRAIPFNDNSLSNNFVWGLAQDSQDSIWIATLKGLDQYEPDTGNFTHHPIPRQLVGEDPSEQEIQALVVDHQEHVWIGTINGRLLRYQPHSGTFQQIASPLPDREQFAIGRIWSLFLGPSGDIWASTSQGNYRVNPETLAVTQLPFGNTNRSQENAIRSIAIGAQYVWIGTNGAGLIRYQPETGELTDWQPTSDNPDGLSYKIIRALHLDASGGLWIGTVNGLNYLPSAAAATDDASFELFTTSDGMPDNTVYGIVPGQSGHLWLTTNLGLSRLDIEQSEFLNFSVEDGLSSREFNGGAELLSDSGTIYLGTVAGVTLVRPDELPRNTQPPPVAFTHLNVGHKPWLEQGRFVTQHALELPYNENDLQFGFAALDFHQPSKNRFRYRMLGLSKDWIETDTSEATYTSLAPGSYTLEVLASNNDGVWSPEPVRFDLTIAAPPWRTGWAYAAYVLALVLLAWRYQRRQATKLSQARQFNDRLRHANDLAEANHELAIHNARYDRITRLPNRQYLVESITEQMAELDGQQHTLALLIINLDRFRQINDGLGIQAGDQVLEQVAERLEDKIGSAGVLARLGGDEFALLVNLPLINDVDSIAETSLHTAQQPIRLADASITPSASIGIAFYPQDARSRSDLMRFADLAMDKAKADGGGQMRRFETAMVEATQSRFHIEERLREALSQQELSLHLQPIVDSASRRVACAEALLRWFPPGRDPIYPDQFIPIAEETGMIVPIGEWVLEQAAQELTALRRSGLHDFRIAVNVSMRQLRDGARLEQVITDVMQRHQLRPGDLELEITETAMMDNLADAARMFARLRAIGCSVSIDDFGTGYSSLNYLKQLPVDKLKIDRSFVSDMHENEQSRRLVASIIRLGHELDLKVVAEGVETRQAAQALSAMGCEYLQGYYFSRPQPADKIPSQIEAIRADNPFCSNATTPAGPRPARAT